MVFTQLEFHNITIWLHTTPVIMWRPCSHQTRYNAKIE